MYNFNFLSGNKTVFSKSIDNLDKDTDLNILLNNIIHENIDVINRALDDSDESQYTRGYLLSDYNQHFFICLDEKKLLNYYLDDEGLLYIEPVNAKGLLSINKLETLKELNLVKWDNINIDFRIASGLGAAGPWENIYDGIIDILESQPITALISAYELTNIGLGICRFIKRKLNKKELRYLTQEWLRRGIYPRQLKEIILTSRRWNKNELAKLLGADERTVLALLYSLGYIKVDRNTFQRSETEESQKARDLWNQTTD